MYSKLAFFVVSAFTLGALAAPQGPATDECSGGDVQCCDSVQGAKSDAVQSLAGTLGIPIGSLTGQLGINCIPVAVLGVSGNNCAHQAACCTGNTFSGLLTVGCSPINVNL